jgi:Replication protein C N-terminal domain
MRFGGRRPDYRIPRHKHHLARDELRRLLEELVDAGFLEARTDANGERMYRRPPGVSDEEWLAGIDDWRNQEPSHDA